MGELVDLGAFRKRKNPISPRKEEARRETSKQPENLFECLPFSVRVLLHKMYVKIRKSQNSGRMQISEDRKRSARIEVSAFSDEALYQHLLQFDGADLRSSDFKKNFRWNADHIEALYERALECPPRGENK